MKWLVRWILRDWTSCFLTCRFPLDGHERASPPRVALRNMAFDKRKDKSFDTIHNHKNNMSRPSKKCNNLRQKMQHIGNRFSSWSLSADEEDFIVICFGEDATFDVVKDDKGVLDGMHKNSNANQQDSDQQDQDCITPSNSKEGEEKEGRQQHRESTGTVCQVEDIEKCAAESRDSAQSDEGSTGSFAFPVLGWEWIGSPVQMPKSEGQHLKKQKARAMRCQCCRF